MKFADWYAPPPFRLEIAPGLIFEMHRQPHAWWRWWQWALLGWKWSKLPSREG